MQAAWEGLMVQYLRRNAERHANMTVAAPTTPAQLFHILRRQVNAYLCDSVAAAFRMSRQNTAMRQKPVCCF